VMDQPFGSITLFLLSSWAVCAIVAAPKRIEMAEKRKSFTNGFMAVLLKMMAC